MKKKSRKVIVLLGAGVLLVLAVLLLYAVGRRLETSGQSQQRGELAQTEQEQTCVVDGITYRKRSDIMSILIMGVDRDSTQQSDGPYEGGQADFQRLIVLDTAHGTVQQLKIDRDTITDVVMLGYLGSPIGTQKMQISLAHGFGDGREESCEYAQQAVEALLGEDTVDYYLAMNLDGIPTLNDLAGGVTVTLEDDFSAMDPAMVQGATLTLHGKQAEYFVRSRMNIGEGTNEARMVRQEAYLEQLLTQLHGQLGQEKQRTAEVLDAMADYVVTDMPRGRMINEIWAARDYTVEPALALEGEHKVAEDGFMEFYPTESSIQQAVLELFWEPVTG